MVNSLSTISGIDVHWDGITFAQSGGYYPPDNALAVGLNEVITAENDAIQLTDTNGNLKNTQSLETFFSSVMTSGYFLTDPKILYDTANQRFIVAIDEVSNSMNSSYVLLAVSKNSAPSLSPGDWTFEAVPTTYMINGIKTWSDQPLVSTDGKDIYITTNQFSSSGSYRGDALTVINETPLLNGLKSNPYSQIAYANPSYQPAPISGGGEYFVSYTHNALSIFKASPTTNGFSTTAPVTLSLGSIDYGKGAYSVSQLGVSYKLDAMDGRITSAAYDSAHQKLYVVFEVQPVKGVSTPSVEWVELDMSKSKPTVQASGNLNSLLPKTGETAGAATFNASIAVDGKGDVLINFNVSGPNMYPADYYTDWIYSSSSNPVFSAPVDYHDSVAAYVDPAKDAIGRWGDYSTAIGDPNNPSGFWISNEFDNGTVTLGGTQTYSSWDTSIAHVLVV
ncbi:MAG: hypothetical protein FDX30_10485 [Chlorobium sp.]|nr:MAG: hypothetical protein FDX30_10485 [Chlorobium sp.]